MAISNQLSTKNPWWLFAPFLGAYLLMIVRLNGAMPIVLMGDEPRYLQYAHNLLHGYFSPKEKLDLWSGPGYPLCSVSYTHLTLPTILRV